MAPDDIYKSKATYEALLRNLPNVVKKPERGKYYCKNKSNLKYFNQIIKKFEVDDLSYKRRIKLLWLMRFITFYIACDLRNVDTKGIDRDDFVIEIRKTFSPNELSRLEREIRTLGRRLFGEDKMPKFFKELKLRVDRSRQTARKDKLTYEEFDRLMKYFSKDITMQAYLSISFESLSRPQELCYTRIKDLEMHENYAIINISDHGKEGIKKLLSMDSFPYLLNMYKNHKDRKNKNTFLFLNMYCKQLTPHAINKKLKVACSNLEIEKPITCYSIKRFGVTFKRLQGVDDITIQRIAGWTSTKQLKVYDLSDQEDVFKIELAKKGLIEEKEFERYKPQTKTCLYCGELIGFSESMCPSCKRLVDPKEIKKQFEVEEKNKEAEKEIREVFSFAMQHPQMSFMEIMDKFRGN